jgi:hypothetical protein
MATFFREVINVQTPQTLPLNITNEPQSDFEANAKFIFTASLNGNEVGSQEASWGEAQTILTAPMPEKSGSYTYEFKQSDASGNWEYDNSIYIAEVKVTYNKNGEPLASVVSLKNENKTSKSI